MSIQTDTKQPLSPTVVKQLILVKRLFLDAQSMGRQEDNELAHLKALLILDLSIETFFKLIISDLDPDGKKSNVKLDEKKDLEFRALRDGVTNLLKFERQNSEYEMPNSAEVLRYHRMRNQAQHDAKIPRLSYLRDYLDDASEILSVLCSELYGIDIWHLRRWDAISNQALREWLQNCEDDLQLQMLDCALFFTRAAYNQVMDGLIRLVYPDPDVPDSILHGPSTDDRFWNDANAGMGRRLKDALEPLNIYLQGHFARLYERLILQDLGLQHARTQRFEQIFRDIHVSVSGTGNILVSHARSLSEIEEGDIQFALNYVFDIAWEIQERYPDYLKAFDFRKHLRDQEFWRVRHGKSDPLSPN